MSQIKQEGRIPGEFVREGLTAIVSVKVVEPEVSEGGGRGEKGR